MAVVELRHVTKKYKLYKSEWQKLKHIFNRRTRIKKTVALDDISFTVNQGEKVAIIGHTGAGKTTLLKMLQGTCFPTKGELILNEPVNAMMGFSAGFYNELTGLENIYFRGQLLGMSDKQIEEYTPRVIEFAELGEYINQPVRTYSNVMKSKLGYALQLNSSPRLVVIDGVMSVGEGKYKEKCLKRMHEICDDDDFTVILSTHQIKSARAFCKRGIVLEKGKIIFDGEVEEAIEVYLKSSSQNELEEDVSEDITNE